MKTINNIDVKNKKVIVRCDLNVTLIDGEIKDDTRIRKSLKTLEYLLNKGAAVIVMSHLGRVKTEEDKKNNSLQIVATRLEELIKMPVKFCPKTRGQELEKLCQSLTAGEIVLIENTRFEDVPEKLESKCDEKLSKYWASLGEIFVNDAFGSSHRAHASVCGIAKYLPAYNGFLLIDEINVLNKAIKKPERPFTVIMGGAKVDDKIDLIKGLINKCDYFIVGGGIANTFLLASGYNVGSSLISEDHIDIVKDIIEKYKDKIIMPVDVVVTDGKQKDLNSINIDEAIYDIGQKSINRFTNIIYNSRTIFINGTVGLYEDEKYENGTKSILESCASADATVIAAGGDSLSAANKYGYKEEFLISTGGGAALEYLAYGELPGIIK